MNLTSTLGSVVLAGVLLAAVPAGAGPRTDTYTIQHPLYGKIGTFVRTAEDAGGLTRIVGRLRVAVKVIGAVVFRRDVDFNQVMSGKRLLSFQSSSNTNGRRADASGTQHNNGFVVTTSSGVATAPTDVTPSDPWALKDVGSGTVVSTESGKIDDVRVTGGEGETVILGETPVMTRHFQVDTEKQPKKWEVWIDHAGVPVKFRSVSDGTPIDFILASTSTPIDGEAGIPSTQTLR